MSLVQSESGAVVRRQGTWGQPAGDFLDQSAASDALEPTQVGALSHVAREEAELKAAIAIARRFPRDEVSAYQRIITSCGRPAFAENAAYSFPRGGQTVTGPSVDLAREMARCWGNVRYGLRVVSEDEQSIHIKGYAFDLETNNLVEAEDKFRKLIYRKKGGWVQPDERDLRELVNRRGAILIRNCILQLLPPDITEDALRKADETNERVASGQLEQDPKAAVRTMVMAFTRLAVSPEMLARYVGHPLDILSAAEIADLRKVYVSIRDGNTRREDHFTLAATDGQAPAPAAAAQAAPASRTDALAAKLEATAPAVAPTVEAPVHPQVEAEPQPKAEIPQQPPEDAEPPTAISPEEFASLAREDVVGWLLARKPEDMPEADARKRIDYILDRKVVPMKPWAQVSAEGRYRAYRGWLSKGFPWRD